MDQSGPNQQTIRRLFARSGNRCAFPKCGEYLVRGTTILGRICHIKAARPEGPRYDPNQSSEDRHGDENLILLCPNHHAVIDSDTEAYTVERLLRMKDDHENKAAPMADDAVEQGVRLLVSVNQSGGIVANNITAHTINVHSAALGLEKQKTDAATRFARQFHRQRITLITSGRGPVELLHAEGLVLHLVPTQALDRTQRIALERLASRPDLFPPIEGRTQDSRANYEGFLIGSNRDGLARPQRGYVQVFSSGIIEAVDTWSSDDLILPNLQAKIIHYAHLYASSLRSLDVGPPIVVLTSLVGVSGKQFEPDFIHDRWRERPAIIIDRDQLDFDTVSFDAFPQDHVATARLLRPQLDHIARAAGLETSPYFDADGTYQLKF